MSTRYVVLAIVPVVLASYLVRSALVALLGRRAPRFTAGVDTWWPWAPLVIVLVVLTIGSPILGLALSVGTAVFLTSSHAVGSPFRPRR